MGDILIQAIGILGTVLFFLSFQFKSNKSLFRVQFVSYLCYTVHLLLLGAITGGISYVLNTVRSFCLGSKREFLKIYDYDKEVKQKLQQACGYNGNGSIHFANAYYPEVFSDKVEIWKGDVFAGSVGIDPQSGLLKINQGGDFGPMEWYGERTDSVFNSVTLDNILQSIGRYCLEEGIGIFDKNRTSNLEVASNDVVKSKDPVLNEAISASQQTKQASIKR